MRVIQVVKFNLFLIFFLYALFSSPAPSSVGLAELFIALSLVVIFVLNLPFPELKKESLLFSIALGCLSYLVSVPSFIGGLAYGNRLDDVLRDLIPMLYMSIPILFYSLLRRYPTEMKEAVVRGILLIGFAYCIRYYYRFLNGAPTLNMQLDPSVFFVTMFSLLSFFYILFYKQSSALKLIATALFAIFFMYILFSSVLRAQVSIFIFVSFLLLILYIKKALLSNKIFDLIVGGIVLVFFAMFSIDICKVVLEKTLDAGVLNGRGQESYEVWQRFTSHVNLFVFGNGWGAKVLTSTTGYEARFVHNFPLFILWKTGLIGFCAFCGYLYWILSIAKQLIVRSLFFRLPLNDLILTWSLVMSLLINSMIEAGYKTLTFSFLVMILIAKSLEMDRSDC